MPLTKIRPRTHAELGELIAVAYEQAERVCRDPSRVSAVAAIIVARLLRRTGNVRAARLLLAP